MKSFKQFQEDAYKPPKTVNKVAKQMEKDGVKFPDAKAFDDIKKFTGEITDYPNKEDAAFKELLTNVKDKATRKLLLIKKIVGSELPIIASGGVMSALDYQEKINAGADLVQIYTGFIFEGPKLIRDILIADSS